jgi:plastocyanin
VQVGASDGTYTAVLAGLKEGQRVVTAGHQNLKSGDSVAPVGALDGSGASRTAVAPGHGAHAPTTNGAPNIQTATVAVTEQGFEPASIQLRPGIPARVTFERKTDATCGTEVIMPDYKIKQTLPLNKPVVVEFTPRQGEFKFACGMDMLRGKVIVR